MSCSPDMRLLRMRFRIDMFVDVALKNLYMCHSQHLPKSEGELLDWCIHQPLAVHGKSLHKHDDVSYNLWGNTST